VHWSQDCIRTGANAGCKGEKHADDCTGDNDQVQAAREVELEKFATLQEIGQTSLMHKHRNGCYFPLSHCKHTALKQAWKSL